MYPLFKRLQVFNVFFFSAAKATAKAIQEYDDGEYFVFIKILIYLLFSF